MALVPHLTRYANAGVTLLGDTRRPGGVTLAFSERVGGTSVEPYESLNLGECCGDDPAAVSANRHLLLEAVGCAHLESRLVNPVQVHGAEVVTIAASDDEAVARAQREAKAGADAIVCTVANVPVLLCFADCVPVVLVAPQGFAVAHSGRKGTELRISERAARALCDAVGCDPSALLAYVGPHIAGADYEVSAEMAEAFGSQFGAESVLAGNRLDLGYAVRQTLVDAGVPAGQILDECPSTARATDRFYSYRAEGGTCGRHGAFAVLLQDESGKGCS